MSIQTESQRNYFETEKNQYKTDLIINPPLHTSLEIGELLKRIRGKNRRAMIIDFGAGTGRITIPLLQRGHCVTAVDISRNSLHSLKKTARKLKLKKLITLPYVPAGRQYSHIIGADIIHHIDIDRYFPVFVKRLKKGGRIIFSEPGAYNPAWYIYLGLFHDWSIEKRLTQCRYFNLTSKLKRAGFTNIKISGLGLLPRPFFNWSKKACVLNDKLGDFFLFKLFAYRYLIEAEKKQTKNLYDSW